MRLISFYRVKDKKQADTCVLSMKSRIDFQASYDRHINPYNNDHYLAAVFTCEADKKLFERTMGVNGVEMKSLSMVL